MLSGVVPFQIVSKLNMQFCLNVFDSYMLEHLQTSEHRQA
jgi:hypothetical protein